LPGFTAHGVVAEAAGEFALGAVDLLVQVVALEVADNLAVNIELMQMAAAVVQVVDLTAIGQGQHGRAAQRVVGVSALAQIYCRSPPAYAGP